MSSDLLYQEIKKRQVQYVAFISFANIDNSLAKCDLAGACWMADLEDELAYLKGEKRWLRRHGRSTRGVQREIERICDMLDG